MKLGAVLVCLVACGRSLDQPPDALPIADGSVSPDGTASPDGMMVDGAAPGGLAIEPPVIRVPAGRDQIFVASDAATWSVMEAGGGTIDASGMYVAPDAPGTYHVIATSGANIAVATVVVEQMYLSVLTGKIGGTGNADGIGQAARFWSPRGMVYDGAGTVFIADEGAIRAIDLATHAVTTVAGNAGGLGEGVGEAVGFSQPWSLAYDASTHTLYTTDAQMLRAINVQTRVVTNLIKSGAGTYVDGPAATAHLRGPRGLCIVGTTLYIADGSGHTIRSVDLASATHDVATVAGTPGVSGFSDNADPLLATFYYPSDIACTPTTLYVADTSNNAIRTIDRATGAVATVVGAPTATYADGDFATARLGYVSYVVADDAHGMLYAVTEQGSDVRALDLAQHSVATITPSSSLSHPAGMAVIGSSLWIADRWHAEVRSIDLASHAATTIAGTFGGPSRGFADGDLATATFSDPQTLALDASGNILVGGNATIRTLSLAAGTVTWRAGTPGAYGRVDGGPTDARLYFTEGMIVDPGGTLWETSVTQTVREIGDDGTVTSRFGGLAQSGTVDQIGTNARFTSPSGIVWVGGKLIVADITDSTIRSIDLASGWVTTIAGVANVHESVDGIGAAAHFQNPFTLATDGISKVWIGDWGSGATIRELDLTTKAVTTIVGDPHVNSLVDGIGTSARICGPWGLAYDGAHSLYIADGGYGPGGMPVAMIRRVWLPTHAVSTFAGTPYHWGAHLGPIQTATLPNPTGLVLTPSGNVVFSGENAIFSIVTQ